MERIILTRKELFNIIWSETMTRISERFNINISRITKVCTDNNIPVPPAGHWQNIKLGKQIDIPELPLDETHKADDEIELVPPQNYRTIRIKEIKEDIEESCEPYLIVKRRLSKPDSLIADAKHELENDEPGSYGREKGYVYSGFNNIPIYITKKFIGRSLRILDAFIKLVKARGHSIEIYNYSPVIFIHEERYEFSLREKQRRIASTRKWHEYDYEPTGKLILSVARWCDKREFIDGKLPIEKQLSKALAYLEYLTEEWEKSMLRHEANERKREKKERLVQEIREKEEQKIMKFHELIELASKWQQAKVLRDFIHEFEENIEEKGKVSEKLQEWIGWAKRKADWHDPLTKGSSFLFSDHNYDATKIM